MKIFWGVVVVLTSLAILVFSSLLVYERFLIYGKWWEATVAIFSLLGVLLTAGAAFATVAAVLSYFSVNEKLKKAENDLDLARQSLENFKKLDRERKALENANNKLKEYKTAVQGLENRDDSDHFDLQNYIERVLTSPNAIFQDRIRANAVKSDLEASEKIKAKEYKSAVELSRYSVACWELLFLYESKKNIANYAKAIFNLSVSKSGLENKDYNEIESLYKKIIELCNQYGIGGHVFSSSYNNWGSILFERTFKDDVDRAESKKLREMAIIKYKKAIEIKSDNYEAYSNWGSTLHCEANAIQDDNPEKAKALRQEAKQILLGCIEKYGEAGSIIYYNLGCIFAKEGNVVETLRSFEKAKQANKLPSKEHITKDTDLNEIRDTPEFQKWFKQAFTQ